jgi:hypothetical protein
MELFERVGAELQLACGWVKVRLRPTPMPDPTKVLMRGFSANDVDGNGDVTLHLRIIHGGLEDQMQNSVVDPDIHAGLLAAVGI